MCFSKLGHTVARSTVPPLYFQLKLDNIKNKQIETSVMFNVLFHNVSMLYTDKKQKHLNLEKSFYQCV